MNNQSDSEKYKKWTAQHQLKTFAICIDLKQGKFIMNHIIFASVIIN